ncbi:MAG: TolC family protein [Proteobacteria bacterium]|nr:TolC family protein [Pseudomonadota bacterium]MBU1739647.1 TolC family protein [Pseudomonadota bacterium]
MLHRLLAILPFIPGLLLFGCSLPENRAGAAPDPESIRYNTLGQVVPVAIPEELQPRTGDDPGFEFSEGKPLELSVEQAVILALQNNRDLRVSRINPVLAGTFAQIERGVFDPELFGELQFTSEKTSDTVEEDGSEAVVGVRQKLSSGAMVEASLAHDRSEAGASALDQKARLGLSVTQSLLRGFGPAVNLARVRQAELNTEATIHELHGVTEALLAESETAYWDYVLARQKIEIFEHSLAIARRQLDEVRQRIEVGILPKIEVAAAHAEVARRQQALIDARSTLEEKRLRLLRLINPGGGAAGGLDFQITATSKPLIDPVPISDLEDRLELARKARPDLNEARLRQKLHRLEIVTTRNGLLPKLDLFISLGKTGYGESFSDSFRNLDENSHDLSGGIRLSHFLGNRQAEGRDLAARATWQQSMEAVENLQGLVELDVRLAVNEAERTRQLIAATRATRILQEETAKAEEERFDVGATTALLVAQAQRDLLESSIGEVEAVVNYRQALVALYLVEGSLLERRGIGLATTP